MILNTLIIIGIILITIEIIRFFISAIWFFFNKESKLKKLSSKIINLIDASLKILALVYLILNY